ncbi:MAG TPA: hypothetical protein VFJ15_07665 [Oleiagrimonas sp.]|nr:hypothetical protein [Oleiagrimonas sp.]
MRFDLPSPRQSQPLLVRIVAGIVAVACLAALVVFGLFALAILAVLAIGWLIWFRWRLYKLRKQAGKASSGAHSDTTSHEHDVIDGEFEVVDEHRDNVH